MADRVRPPEPDKKSETSAFAEFLTPDVQLLIAKTMFFGGLAGFFGLSGYMGYQARKDSADLPDKNDKRERMANQLLSRGHATVDQLLEASYGEWPPKGLDIIGKNDQRVNFVHLFSMANLSIRHPIKSFKKIWYELNQVAGRARIAGDREIGLHSLTRIFKPLVLGKSNVVSTLGHEATHILQGDHYYRAKEMFLLEDAQNIWGRNTAPRSEMFAKVIFKPEYLKPGVNLDENAYKGLSGNLGYLTRGIEIQARMHQLLSEGYQHWKVMPTTKEEVMISLKNMGVKPPKDIQEKLEALPGYNEINEKFKYQPERVDRSTRGAATQLNMAQNALTAEGQTRFWGAALPYLYGDLIEMYGDRYGLERFAATVNHYRIFRERKIESQMLAQLHPQASHADNRLKPAIREPAF